MVSDLTAQQKVGLKQQCGGNIRTALFTFTDQVDQVCEEAWLRATA